MSESAGSAGHAKTRTRNVQGTYQISATLGRERFPDVSQRFDSARRMTLRWMQRRMQKELGQNVPVTAWEGESFEIDLHGQFYGAATLPDLGLWTCRIEHDDPEVAARTWTVDLALRQVASEVILVERTLCTSPASCQSPVPYSLPRIVPDLVQDIGLRDALPITGKPWFLKNTGDLELLELALSDAGRLIPVVMLTEADENSRVHTYKVDRFVLSPENVANDLLGLAHLAVMPRELGFEWTKRVGKMWSAFNGAIRTFRAGINFANDDPYRHPLIKLDDIVLWEYHGVLSESKLFAEEAFQCFLKEKMFQAIASRPLRHEDALFYRYAKVQNLASKSAGRTSAGQIEQQLRLEIEELRKEAEQERGEKDFAYNYSAELEEKVQRLEKERFSLRAQLDALREKLGDAARKEIPIPKSLEDLEEWQRQVAGQLVIVPKAIREASRSDYSDPQLVYRSLLLLANEYRQMRLHGGSELRAAYNEGLKKLKLTESKSISKSRAGEQGDEYYASHPFESEKRVFLEDHLRHGTGRSERDTLRIYFAWDQQEQLVVVGWLPSHLETRNS